MIRSMLGECTVPRPVQVGHAPAGLLNEKCPMLNSGTSVPHCGHGYISPESSSSPPLSAAVSSMAAAALTSNVGGISALHFGQGRWPMRANKMRRYVKTSVEVPTVERGLRLAAC